LAGSYVLSQHILQMITSLLDAFKFIRPVARGGSRGFGRTPLVA